MKQLLIPFTILADVYTITAQAQGYVGQTAIVTLTNSGYAQNFALEPTCIPAQILDLQANVTQTLSGGSVQFTATLTGTQPISLTWHLGNVEIVTGTLPNLNYTFPLVSAPQTYTVSMSASNTCTVSIPQTQIAIRVEPYRTFLPFAVSAGSGR